jgi:hypothetical protein
MKKYNRRKKINIGRVLTNYFRQTLQATYNVSDKYDINI